jgi:hypothetical protein
MSEIKILIQENANIAENLIRILEATLPQIQKVGAEFLELGTGPLTIETLSDILLNDCQGTAEKCLSVLKSQLNGKSKLQTTAMTRIVEETIDQVLADIRSIVSGKDYHSSTTGTFQGDLSEYANEIVKYISFENDKPILSSSAKDQICEDKRLYIRSEPGKNLWEKHCAAVNAINELVSIIHNIPGINISPMGIANVFWTFTGSDKFEMPVIDYDRLLAGRLG